MSKVWADIKAGHYWKGFLSAIPFVAAVANFGADYAMGHVGSYGARDFVAIVVGALTTISVVAKGNEPEAAVEGDLTLPE